MVEGTIKQPGGAIHYNSFYPNITPLTSCKL